MNGPISTTFRVGRYRCSMSVQLPLPEGQHRLQATWHPKMPRRLSRVEMETYRQRRDAFFAEVAKQLGGTVLVVEA